MEKIEISHRTIIFTVLFLIGIWLLYQIRGVLLLLFIAFILMNALNPLVSSLEKIKIPRILSSVLVFIIGLIVISLIVAGIVPPLVEQLNVLTNFIAEQFPDFAFFQISEQALISQIETLSRNALNLLRFVTGAASNLLGFFSIIVLTIYLLLERKKMPEYLQLLFNNHDSEQKAKELIGAFEKRLGGWVRGEALLMLIVGLLTYVGLTLLGIPFALPLALLAGLLELVPNLGPIISSIPAIIAGLTISPMLALGVLILYVAVQQLENNLIVPIVMRQSAGVNPLITLLSLMVGLTLGGIGGAILAVPFYITIEVALKHFFKYHYRK